MRLSKGRPTSEIKIFLERKLRGINIEKEYELIQAKQSSLPSATRKVVVAVYESAKKEQHLAQKEDGGKLESGL